MESEHIENRRLYVAVTQEALLEPAEVEHLRSCEECLEMVRILVRQQIQLSKGAYP
jgi:hypothetical protein